MPSRSRSSLRRKRSKPVLKRAISLRVEELESRLLLDATPSGYTPAQIRHAYALDQISTLLTAGAPAPANSTAAAGQPQTSAITDASYDASLAS